MPPRSHSRGLADLAPQTGNGEAGHNGLSSNADVPEVQLDPNRPYRLAKVATKLTDLIPASVWSRKGLPKDRQDYYNAVDLYHGFEDNVRDHITQDDPRYEELVEFGKSWDKQLGIFGFPASQISNTWLEYEKKRKNNKD